MEDLMKYRAKPIEIEAEQWTSESKPAAVTEETPGYGFVTSKQGRVACALDDFIIAEPDGSGYYPCAPSIFRAKYDLIPEFDPGATVGHQVSKLSGS
jgi:hypothetical protein